MDYAEWKAQQATNDRRADVGFPVEAHNLGDAGSIPAPATNRGADGESSEIPGLPAPMQQGHSHEPRTIDTQRAMELALTADEYYDLDPEERRQVRQAINANSAELARRAASSQRTTRRKYKVL